MSQLYYTGFIPFCVFTQDILHYPITTLNLGKLFYSHLMKCFQFLYLHIE
ncbi:hypothetical protein SPYAA216_0432 [Streptococcus pyogenes AA216]|nr:hypothetical protein SPYAA216_0432 [Streptococcus pyogenes AA216]